MSVISAAAESVVWTVGEHDGAMLYVLMRTDVRADAAMIGRADSSDAGILLAVRTAGPVSLVVVLWCGCSVGRAQGPEKVGSGTLR